MTRSGSFARTSAAGVPDLPAATVTMARAAGRPVWWAVLIAICMVLVAPLLIVDMPPLVDYPNHLARVFVLASLPHDPVIARFYAAHWSIIPNLALDLVAPPMLAILPVHVVGRLLMAAAAVLPVLGAVAYSSAVAGSPGARWWCLGVGLVAYNGTLLEGFLNFNLGVGLALLLAAGWIRWQPSYPRVVTGLAAAGAVMLFACHLMSLLFFAILLGSAELARLLAAPADPRTWLRAALSRGIVLAMVFAAPAALYQASALSNLGGDAAFAGPADKLRQLLAAFTGYSLALDRVTAVLALAFPCLCLLLRRGRMPPPAAVAAGVLLIAYLATPYGWKGTFQIDTRFAIMLGFMLFAGFVPVRWPVALARIVAVAGVVLFIARIALLTLAWYQHRADLADLRLALQPVQPGQAVYVGSVSPTDPQSYWARAPWSRRLSNGVQTDTHLGALALIEHRAWWPFEFDNPAQQPIRTLPPYQAMAGRVGDLPDQAETMKADLCGFDLVLLTEADAAPGLPEGRFHLLVRTPFADLYRIDVCRTPA